MRAWLAGAALLALTGARADTDYAALLDEALEAVHWQFDQDWAYTYTTLRDDKLWVARHDPHVGDNDGWTLISVDGREPTGRERREFLSDMEDHGEDDDDDNRVVRAVQQDTLELIQETDSHWLFSFVPQQDEDFMTELEATLRIAKDGRYIESLEMINEGDIDAGFGTTLSNFIVKMSFGPAVEDGPIVPRNIKLRLTGRALLFISIEETEAIEYSDFVFAGD